MTQSPRSTPDLSRRTVLGSLVSAGVVAAWARGQHAVGEESPGKASSKGRIKQSIVFWCFNVAGDKWDIEKTCQVANQLGCKSIELTGPENWGVMQKHGLTCAIAPNGMPGAPFMKLGFNNPDYHEEVIARTSKMIDDCAAAKVPSGNRLYRLQVSQCG